MVDTKYITAHRECMYEVCQGVSLSAFSYELFNAVRLHFSRGILKSITQQHNSTEGHDKHTFFESSHMAF